MKKVIIVAILMFALTTQAYGWGHRGGDAPNYGGSQSSGAIQSNSGGNGALFRNPILPATLLPCLNPLPCFFSARGWLPLSD